MVHMVELVETASEEAQAGGGAQSIGRAAALLRLLAAGGDEGLGLAGLVDASGLLKPTCRRILLALMEAGLVEQEAGSRRYFLGPEAYVLGTLAAKRFGVHAQAGEAVRRLAQLTGDAAFLQLRRDDFVVCLQREDGDYPIRSYVLAAGDRHPLGVGAAGITLLAALPDEEVERTLAVNARLIGERYPSLTQAVIRGLVREARLNGYGFNRGLLFPGSWGMGVAVRDAAGHPVACLSLAAVESRMPPERQAYLAGLLREEVQRLEMRLAEPGRSEARRATMPRTGIIKPAK